MFTGLIQDVGSIERVGYKTREAVLSIRTSLHPLKLGESIAVNGVCLSVIETSPSGFRAFASEETLRISGLGKLAIGARVNLERALCVGDPIGGHLVAGHVDAQVEIISRDSSGAAERWTLSMPVDKNIRRQLAPKGSVTLDGVSLTVNDVRKSDFTIMVIPLTLRDTTLGGMPAGTNVNLETDTLAKYVARQLEPEDSVGEALDMELLIRNGFVR